MCFKITCNTEVYFQRTYIFIFVEHFMKKSMYQLGNVYDRY